MFKDRERGDCNALQLLYDPDARPGDQCSPQQPENCKQGDLSGRLGLVRAASRSAKGFIQFNYIQFNYIQFNLIISVYVGFSGQHFGFYVQFSQ